MESTALSWDSRRLILSQEVIRRCMNSHPGLPLDEVNKVNKFTTLMLNSGFNREQTREVMVAGLTGSQRKVKEAKVQGKFLHRSAKDSAGARRVKKLSRKTTGERSKNKAS